MNKPVIAKNTTIQFGPDYLPSIIDIPVSVDIFGESDDSMGRSQLSVLLDALDSHKKSVMNWNNETEKEATLECIWELRLVIMNRAMGRLSQVTGLLHDIRFDTHRIQLQHREPLT